jgi:hypothetical protein
MASFSFNTKLGDSREVTITTTWPVALPEEDPPIEAGDPYPLDEASEIWFTAKLSPAHTDEAAVFVKKLSTDDIVVDGSTATFEVTAEDVDELLDANTTVQLFCDVQVKSSSDKIWTVAEGKWKMTNQITQGA